MLGALRRTTLISRLLGVIGPLVVFCLLDDRPHGRADSNSLPDEILDPLDASDLLVAVQAVPARGAPGVHEPVPMLPGAERRRRDPGAPAHGFQRQAGRKLVGPVARRGWRFQAGRRSCAALENTREQPVQLAHL